MSQFVIVGTGGMGRELLGWIASSGDETRRRFGVAAFISEGDDAGATLKGLPVIHPDRWDGAPPRFVLAFGDPLAKRRIAEMLESRGWSPETFVHEQAAVGEGARIGAGTVICAFCRVSTDSTIGRHVLVNGGSGVGHDAVVGDYSSLLGSVSVNGNVIVGEGVTFGAGSMIYPGKKVGAWTRIGLGSVVLRSVPEGATVFGNPAKQIGRSVISR